MVTLVCDMQLLSELPEIRYCRRRRQPHTLYAEQRLKPSGKRQASFTANTFPRQIRMYLQPIVIY